MSKTYWTILGVKPNASQEEIKKAYRRKAFEFHPDKNKSVHAEQQFIELTEAYEFLKSSQNITYTDTQVPSNAAHDKAQQEAKRKARMAYEKFRKERALKESKELLKIRIIGVGFFVVLTVSIFINPWIGVFITVLGFCAGLLGHLYMTIKHGARNWDRWDDD